MLWMPSAGQNLETYYISASLMPYAVFMCLYGDLQVHMEFYEFEK